MGRRTRRPTKATDMGPQPQHCKYPVIHPTLRRRRAAGEPANARPRTRSRAPRSRRAAHLRNDAAPCCSSSVHAETVRTIPWVSIAISSVANALCDVPRLERGRPSLTGAQRPAARPGRPPGRSAVGLKFPTLPFAFSAARRHHGGKSRVEVHFEITQPPEVDRICAALLARPLRGDVSKRRIAQTRRRGRRGGRAEKTTRVDSTRFSTRRRAQPRTRFLACGQV